MARPAVNLYIDERPLYHPFLLDIHTFNSLLLCYLNGFHLTCNKLETYRRPLDRRHSRDNDRCLYQSLSHLNEGCPALFHAAYSHVPYFAGIPTLSKIECRYFSPTCREIAVTGVGAEAPHLVCELVRDVDDQN